MPQDVYTQAELDEALKREGVIHCWDDASFSIFGSTTVYAHDSVTVYAHDSVTVYAHDSAKVIAHDSAKVFAFDSAKVFAYDSATVFAFDSATVFAYGSAKVFAFDSATVCAYDSATVSAYGSAKVSAYGSAKVFAYDSATIHRVPSEVTASDSPPQAHDGVRRITTRASHIDLVEPLEGGRARSADAGVAATADRRSMPGECYPSGVGHNQPPGLFPGALLP